ncbi:NUDIX hydrolase [Nesterenkonia suensis]
MDAVLTIDHSQDAAAPDPDLPPQEAIRVSAVVVRNSEGQVLTVRKSGTERFMLPGGKPELGESPLETAVRECGEELGVEFWPEDLRALGTFEAAAANEPGRRVIGEVFLHDAAPAAIEAAPSAEIAELRWLCPSTEPLPQDLAPLLSDAILPALQTETGVTCRR